MLKRKPRLVLELYKIRLPLHLSSARKGLLVFSLRRLHLCSLPRRLLHRPVWVLRYSLCLEHLRLLLTSLEVCFSFRCEVSESFLVSWFIVLLLCQHICKYLGGSPSILEEKGRKRKHHRRLHFNKPVKVVVLRGLSLYVNILNWTNLPV
jgi:hypothetical protein